VTPVVLYISFASAMALSGHPVTSLGPILGAVSALIIAVIVPVMEIRMQMWINGSVVDPVVPIPPEEKLGGQK
jgi:hypothetical protein